MPAHPEEADHVTAIYGDWVVLNCVVDFPEGEVVPYVVTWWRKDKPVYMWYSNYPSHVDSDYKDRVARVPLGSNYGLARYTTEISARIRLIFCPFKKNSEQEKPSPSKKTQG